MAEKTKEEIEKEIAEKGYVTYDIQPHDVVMDVIWEFKPVKPKKEEKK